MSLETAQLRIAEIRSLLGMAPGAPAPTAAPPATTAAGGGSPFAATLAAATTATAASAAPPPPAPLGGVAPSSSAVGDAIVSVARAEVGQAEFPNGSNDGPRIAEYRTATRGAIVGPWCAYFASWVTAQAGVPLGDQAQGFGRVDDVAAWGQRTGRWTAAGSGTPQPGDLIIFDEHMGIVEAVLPDGTVQTIEGNTTGNVVARRSRSQSEPLGYVRPG